MISRREEDYLETILNLKKEKETVKTKNIANKLGIKSPSVVEMLEKLNNKNLVDYRKYKGVKLTKKGKSKANSIKYRHETIKDFLKILNVPDEIANEDACVMEHELHQETVEQIRKLIEFVNEHPRFPKWLKHFEDYCDTGEHKCEKKE